MCTDVKTTKVTVIAIFADIESFKMKFTQCEIEIAKVNQSGTTQSARTDTIQAEQREHHDINIGAENMQGMTGCLAGMEDYTPGFAF